MSPPSRDEKRAREIVQGADMHSDVCDCHYATGLKTKCTKLREWTANEIAQALARERRDSMDEAAKLMCPLCRSPHSEQAHRYVDPSGGIGPHWRHKDMSGSSMCSASAIHEAIRARQPSGQP